MSRRQQQRRAIAAEAARLMVDEGVREYITAKRIAADNVLGVRHGSPIQLPSNGEIRAAIVLRSSVVEGQEARREHLFQMRLTALQVMQALAGFSPRIIGSVASGAIHATSDIDIQVFCDSHTELEHVLFAQSWDPERIEHEVFKDGRFRQFVHFHFEHRGERVELSVYEPAELWRVSISSVNGKPIDRVPRGRLLQRVKREHGERLAQECAGSPEKASARVGAARSMVGVEGASIGQSPVFCESQSRAHGVVRED